jgi:3-phosphoshikimate 1-carboxyvinyltransferase
MLLNFTHLNANISIALPASKSISNRALIINYLTNNNCVLNNLSTANDTIILQQALQEKGLVVNIGDAGTAYRFCTALFACTNIGKVKILTGTPHLRTRPISDLVTALNNLGANIAYTDKIGFGPLKITGQLITKNHIEINGNMSSQFISALCLIAPILPNGLTISIAQNMVSASYIKMTHKVQAEFGNMPSISENNITYLPQPYLHNSYNIENDWSSAAFFYGLIMLAPQTTIQLQLLKTKSIQGDANIANICIDFGINTLAIENDIIISNNHTIELKKNYDATEIPDGILPIIVACSILHPHITFTGLSTLVDKECNRIAALQTELYKIGIIANYQNEILSFKGAFNQNAIPHYNTYNDHRIAMSLAITALVLPNIYLDNTDCVSKSFPKFWEQLKALGLQIK